MIYNRIRPYSERLHNEKNTFFGFFSIRQLFFYSGKHRLYEVWSLYFLNLIKQRRISEDKRSKA